MGKYGGILMFSGVQLDRVLSRHLIDSQSLFRLDYGTATAR